MALQRVRLVAGWRITQWTHSHRQTQSAQLLRVLLLQLCMERRSYHSMCRPGLSTGKGRWARAINRLGPNVLPSLPPAPAAAVTGPPPGPPAPAPGQGAIVTRTMRLTPNPGYHHPEPSPPGLPAAVPGLPPPNWPAGSSSDAAPAAPAMPSDVLAVPPAAPPMPSFLSPAMALDMGAAPPLRQWMRAQPQQGISKAFSYDSSRIGKERQQPRPVSKAPRTWPSPASRTTSATGPSASFRTAVNRLVFEQLSKNTKPVIVARCPPATSSKKSPPGDWFDPTSGVKTEYDLPVRASWQAANYYP